MTSKRILCLDLSTTSTGWSIFEGTELRRYNFMKPKVKGVTKLKYPVRQLEVCKNIAEQIKELFDNNIFEYVVIEEINRHKSRMSGKTLDILHGFVWQALQEVGYLEKVIYMDSDGATGWRTRLNLIMSDADRAHNKEAKKLNKQLQKGTKKIPIINKKHLAARFVNQNYGTSFDVDEVKTDADVCDSIGLGHAFIKHLLPALSSVE